MQANTNEASNLRIGLILPADFQVVSYAPLAVFEMANAIADSSIYQVDTLSENGGSVPNSFGLRSDTRRLSAERFDTVIVGSTLTIPKPSKILCDYLRSAISYIRRIAAIGAGAFQLAESGILDGRRATTHWAYADELKRRFPKIAVESDRIFVTDGPIWTSAGMTAGVDLALGFIERDMGPDAAREVARALVVPHRRAGGQSQRSALLDLDARSDRVRRALVFARENLDQQLSVEQLAEAACLSPRQFSRVFRAETGLSPAKAVQNLRVESARLMLEQGRRPVEEIARTAGFGDRERMRRSFMRTFDRPPREVRNAAHAMSAL